jgi:hypothetical protein
VYEFVEIDEAGNPRKKAARGRQRPQPAVRKKAPARRKLPAVKAPPGAAEAESAEEEELETEEAVPDVAAGTVPPPEGLRRSGGATRRNKGRGTAGATES